jgi:predicted transposase/invertase (TIGR01784 family)
MSLSKFLDPKNDFCFKRIFGTERNSDILIDFINAMLRFKEGERIQAVKFLKTSQDPEIAYKKQSLVDVLCTDQRGWQYIIEMQVAHTTGFEKRAQYYAAKAYSGQLQQGEHYHELKAIIFMAITDFVMFPDKEEYLSNHVLLDNKTFDHDLKDFSFTFLELPKFPKTVADVDNLTDVIERWTYFFRYAEGTHEKDIERIAGKDSAILRAYEELNRFNLSQIELNTYEREEKRERDAQSILLAKLWDAEAKGKAEGKAEGGTEKQYLIAKNMLLDHVPIEAISKYTGLSVEVIRQMEAE